jgi:hypothetical protein
METTTINLRDISLEYAKRFKIAAAMQHITLREFLIRAGLAMAEQVNKAYAEDGANKK